MGQEVHTTPKLHKKIPDNTDTFRIGHQELTRKSTYLKLALVNPSLQNGFQASFITLFRIVVKIG